ncbi:tetratricopeptide repeat protein 33-like [Penaeus chinensis]|uniref:tetratricopeptide repeat protein 33-like n=1 Tax=Penaeus chinensis TaxID=139456 RepID=UPI001FB6AA0B|nr:tetratricopeptide repeat protein 33-like [Penaeus chinensis]
MPESFICNIPTYAHGRSPVYVRYLCKRLNGRHDTAARTSKFNIDLCKTATLISKESQMQSFGWKRKAGLTKPKPAVFSQDNVEVDNDMNDPDVDWLTATKKPKVLQLEDAKAKARRLSNEGVMLAESERWWAAIGRWNAALTLTPDDYALHEMLAQAYMQVGEVFPALRSAEAAVQLYPNWWVGLQTLGRAQLGLGDVAMAVKTFSKAVHIRPDEQELWREDLQWAVGLLKKYKEIEAEKEKMKDGATITEPSIEGTVRERSIQIYDRQRRKEALLKGNPEGNLDNGSVIDVTKMVRMRVT